MQPRPSDNNNNNAALTFEEGTNAKISAVHELKIFR